MTQNASVLLLSGFDEPFVVTALELLISSGLRVQLIGLKRGIVSGRLGLHVQVNHAIDGLNGFSAVTTLLLPPCKQSHGQLMTDPRLHRFIAGVLERKGRLLLAPDAARVLQQVGIVDIGASGCVVLDSSEVVAHLL
ncbi:MAG: hypothetical protein M9918_07950 [Anaerolineae bacterium]|nr:hypothetical protein [Anaerolineae bacterium]